MDRVGQYHRPYTQMLGGYVRPNPTKAVVPGSTSCSAEYLWTLKRRYSEDEKPEKTVPIKCNINAGDEDESLGVASVSSRQLVASRPQQIDHIQLNFWQISDWKIGTLPIAFRTWHDYAGSSIEGRGRRHPVPTGHRVAVAFRAFATASI